MSETLSEKLRSAANGLDSFKTVKGDFGLADEAADEIDRLRAENARLREALVEAMIVPEAFVLSGRPAHMRDDVWEQIQRSVTIARAVIQTKGGTNDQT